jgi:hypothetical protein
VHARIALGLFGLLAAAPASADDGEPHPWLFDLTLHTEIGLSKGDAGNPVSVAPDLSILTKGFPQIEIVHSSSAITGFHGLIRGTSLCVSGDGCDAYEPSAYHNGGLQFSKALRSHGDGREVVNKTAFGVVVGLIANAIDPFALALKVGVRGSYLTSDLIQLQIAPAVHLGLSQRDAQEDRVFVPVTMTVLASTELAMQIETGITGPFDAFSDNLQVPVSLNLDITADSGVALIASFSLPAAVAGDAVAITGIDARVLTVGVRWSKFVGNQQ